MSTSGSATWALISDTSNATITNAGNISHNQTNISTNAGNINHNQSSSSTNAQHISTIVGYLPTPENPVVPCAPLSFPTFTGAPKVSPSVSLLPSHDDTTNLATTRWVKSKPWSNVGGPGTAHLAAGASQATPNLVQSLQDGTAVKVTLIGGGGGGGVAGGNQPGSSDGTGGESYGSSAGGGGGGGGGGVVIFWIQKGTTTHWNQNWNVGTGGAAFGNTYGGDHGTGIGTGDGDPTSWYQYKAYGGKQGGNAAPPANGAAPGPGIGGDGGSYTSENFGQVGVIGGAGQAGGSGVAWDSASPIPGIGGPGAHGWSPGSVGAGGAGAFYTRSDDSVDWHPAAAGGDGMVIFEWFI